MFNRRNTYILINKANSKYDDKDASKKIYEKMGPLYYKKSFTKYTWRYVWENDKKRDMNSYPFMPWNLVH